MIGDVIVVVVVDIDVVAELSTMEGLSVKISFLSLGIWLFEYLYSNNSIFK